MQGTQVNAEIKGWAEHNFGGAELGDVRRRDRLVAIAAAAASSPAGTVTRVLRGSAEREGAFRLLESEHVSARAVSAATFAATATRCDTGPVVFVAMDATTLTLTDRDERRELGRVGTSLPSRGLHVMNSLAVDACGTTVGLLDQIWWARDQPQAPKKRNRTKCYAVPFARKETRHWVDGLIHVDEVLRKEAPRARPWFQMDRGADCWAVFKTAIERKLLVTVRATHNRRLADERGRERFLRDKVLGQPVLGYYTVHVPGRPGREARDARMALRACSVEIIIRVTKKRRERLILQAVSAREVGRPTNDRLSWTLLTTHAVGSFQEARLVIEAYSYRWRVEDFHRAWKGGGCNVEDTQLHTREAILKWATILAAVAARAVRLAQLARTTPDLPAADEFTVHEIEAAFLLAKRKRDRRKTVLLSEMISLVAREGGFAGEYSGRLPGAQVLARGLARIQVLARGLRNLEEMR